MSRRSRYGVWGVVRSASVVEILSRPRRCLIHLRETSPWLGALLAVTISAAAVGGLSSPFAEKGMRLAMEERLADANVAAMAEEASAPWLAVAGEVVVVPLSVVVQALFVWALILSFGGQGTFRQVLSVTAHLNVVSQIHAWAGFVWLTLRGVEAIESVADAEPTLGLNVVVRSAVPWLDAVLGGINPFAVWFMALLGAAAVIVFGLRRSSGVAIATAYWFITVALVAAGRTLATRLLEV